MLKEAIEYLAGLAKETKKDLKVEEIGDTVFIHSPNRERIETAPVIKVGANCGNTIDGFIAFVNSLTEFYPYVRVNVEDVVLSVYATGGELGVKSLSHVMAIETSWTWDVLNSLEFHDVAWWRRMLRNSALNETVLYAEGVVTEMKQIELEQSTKHLDTDRSASKASYGTEVQQVVSSQKENALSEVRVKVNWFSDPRLHDISEAVFCYWEFDHAMKRLCLVPMGKDLMRLKRYTQRAINEILKGELDPTIVFAGRNVGGVNANEIIIPTPLDNPGDDDI